MARWPCTYATEPLSKPTRESLLGGCLACLGVSSSVPCMPRMTVAQQLPGLSKHHDASCGASDVATTLQDSLATQRPPRSPHLSQQCKTFFPPRTAAGFHPQMRLLDGAAPAISPVSPLLACTVRLLGRQRPVVCLSPNSDSRCTHLTGSMMACCWPGHPWWHAAG